MTLQTNHWDRLENGGLTFTKLGMGMAPLGNLYRPISDEEAQTVLTRAWDAGVRYFDTAPLYGLGLSETRLNSFLRGKDRDSYVLSTKVGRLLKVTTPDLRDGHNKWFNVPARTEVFDYTYDGVMRSVEFSLERLGLDRIDILYAHDIDLVNHGSRLTLDTKLAEFMAGGYHALVSLRGQGVIKAFGAGVNEWQPCQWLAERGDFDIFLLAGRYTLLEQEALGSFLPLCDDRGIGIVIGGPYNSGVLASGPKPGAFYNYERAPNEILARVSEIEKVCAAHTVRMVDAAFQFPLRHPAVLSVIPGGQGLDEMESNISAESAVIPQGLWSDLKSAGLMREDAP
ncbi:aldo/keto reductase [Pseudopelagicola sp. nBUS_20]|uniref:aldo/keto reductase n=1 Tax=Pseudopelagicola sp. nBUS_20 TaxID=3395317 RepID=UPI003EB960A4